MRMLPALAFVPSDQVIDVFERFSDRVREIYGEEADQLLDYFEDTYIGTYRRNVPRAAPLFPIDMWNMFHRKFPGANFLGGKFPGGKFPGGKFLGG